jgi:hypothetical protein
VVNRGAKVQRVNRGIEDEGLRASPKSQCGLRASSDDQQLQIPMKELVLGLFVCLFVLITISLLYWVYIVTFTKVQFS